MTEIGHAALYTALALALFATVAPVIGARRRLPELLSSARRGVLVVAGLVTVASLVLIYALLTHKFELEYVASYTSLYMSPIYLLSAFWAGNAGSLLLWAWVLAIFGAVVVLQTRERNRELAPYVFSLVMAIEAFFLAILVFAADPFQKLPYVPSDGMGLNPLLENPGMFFHPTTLYLGYVGLTIPFAFAIAALITGRLSDQWIRSTRRWTLFAWAFLFLGNMVGAQWAYVELGWGGYWAWDPVENASFMPLLLATAYLHSVMIQERRGMLKVWNMVLIILTFALVMFGTFITRSGVIQSVHTFGQSVLGASFLAFIAVTLVGSVGLLVYRLPLLRSEHRLDSLLSRESSFLFNNLLFVGIAFATFLGTVFPLISEAVRGTKITVSAPFFNWVNGPIFLALILLMGICPLIGWRKASRDNLVRNFLYPLGTTVAVVGLLYGLGVRGIAPLVAFSLCVFVASTLGLEVFRGTRARRRGSGRNWLSSLLSLVWGNKRRYGGYIVHLAVILIAIGIIGSTFFKTEAEASLARGESMQIRGYTLTYEGLSSRSDRPDRQVVSATVNVYNEEGRKLSVEEPARTFDLRREGSSTAEVAIRSTPRDDLYIILAGWEENEVATFKVLVNPLVFWMWTGMVVLVGGAVFAFWPDARERRRALVLEQAALREVG